MKQNLNEVEINGVLYVQKGEEKELNNQPDAESPGL